MKGTVFADTIGWINPAGRKRGVVVAGAHGHEDLCSRRFLKLLCDRAAEAGMPTLQYDYPGCGNAAGDHTAPGQVAAWVASVGAAIDRLKRECGVADVILVGFRLGALLAPLAAAGRDDVAGLALLAPPASGKAYVREIVAMARMIGAPPAGIAPQETYIAGCECAGFRLSHETLADLSVLDWQQAVARLPNLPMLVVGNGKPAGFTPNEATTVAPFDGYPLLMCDPTANRIPFAVLDRCAAWLATHAGSGSAAAARPAARPVLHGPHYTEEPVMIEPAPAICAVLCRPRGRPAKAEPQIILNAGGVPHVGWARGTVETARDLAAAGVVSLRIDLPGLGLSGAAEPGRLFLYDARIRHDVVRAIDWMEQAGFPTVGLVGICSGAFQAFHTARADRRVGTVTMINPLCFAWNKSYALDLAVWKTYEASKAGSPREEPHPQRRLAGARLQALAARRARLLARRAIEAAKSALWALHRPGLAGRRRVERWMRQLCGRGVRVLMITSEGDLSLEEIARHFGPGGERLDDITGVSRLSLPNADHTLTRRHARRMVAARLIDHAAAKSEEPPSRSRDHSASAHFLPAQ